MSPKISAKRREQYLEEKRNHIIDVAIEIFGSKGLDVATVDEIAQAAGIAKGTIYLYFKSKDEIFDAILAERSLMPQMVDLIESPKISMESDEFTLEIFLEKMGEGFLSAMENISPLFRLVIADAYKFPVQAEHVYNNLILKFNQAFAELLTAQVEAGKIKPLDSPLITARCFIGMLIIYVLSQEMMGGKKFTTIKRDEWIKETVRIFLKGIQVSE
jgi:AcrR family transcriptional regulator